MSSAETERRPRRGRPSLEQAVRISNAIVDAATELFLARGFVDTTMDDIAARAGVPKSTIYKRHEDKAALLRAVIISRIEQRSSLSEAGNAQLPDTLEQRLRVLAVNVLCSPETKELQALTRLTEGNWDGAREVAQVVHEAGYIRMLDFLEADIATFANAGPETVKDARSVAECLLAQLAGWLVTARPGNDNTSDAVAFAHRAVELLIHGRAKW